MKDKFTYSTSIEFPVSLKKVVSEAAPVAAAVAPQVLGATSGVVRSLGGISFIAGAALGALALGIVYKLCNATEGAKPVEDKNMPFGSTLLKVQTTNRSFLGFLLDDEIDFTCQGQLYTLPYSKIQKIGRDNALFYYTAPSVKLVDGFSEFRDIKLVAPRDWRFATMAGIQTIRLFEKHYRLEQRVREKEVLTYRGFWKGDVRELVKETYHENVEYEQVCFPKIQNLTVREVRQYAQQLEGVLSSNLDQVYDIIGKDKLSEFFDLDDLEDARRRKTYV
jgi:hypothetical protein